MTASPSSDRVGRHGFQLALCCLFALPLLVNVIATRLGYVVFFLADPTLQFVWGTLCLFLGYWALAARGRTTGRLGWLLVFLAVFGLGLYLWSLTAAFPGLAHGTAGHEALFGIESGLMLMVVLGRLWDARRTP